MDGFEKVCSGDRPWWDNKSKEALLQKLEGGMAKLPYSVIEEGEEFLVLTLKNFTHSVAKQDWDALSSFILDDLEELTNLKIQPNRSILIKLIHALYQLATMEPFPNPALREKAAKLLTIILRKNKKLLLGDGFTIDHGPLFKLLDSILFPQRRLPPSIPCTESLGALISLAKRARHWFAKDSSEEIISSVWVDLNPLCRDQMCRAVCLLSIFLPSNLDAARRVFDLLTPESFLWSANCKRFEILLLSMLVKVAKKMKYNQWARVIPFYMGITCRHLRIPQPESNSQDFERILYRHKSSLSAVKDQFPSGSKIFAKFLAFALLADDQVLGPFKTFIAGLDSYCHPSNQGGWTDEICQLISHNLHVMARIVSKGGKQIPSNVLLEYSEIIWPALNKLSYSKNPLIVLNVSIAIRHLVYLRPISVMRDVLTSAATTLISNSEPHRTLSSLVLLARSARLQLEAENPLSDEMDLLTLLPSCVIGLDYNDPFKTATTLNLFASVFSSLPLVTCENPNCDWQSSTISNVYFEDLVVSILDQSFLYIDKMSSMFTETGEVGPLENSIFQAFGHVWTLLFAQMPRDLWDLAYGRVKSFALESRGPSSRPLITRLFGAVKGRHHKEALKGLLPLFIESISKQILENDIGTDARQGDGSCGTLIWYMSCLLGLVRYSTSGAVDFLEMLLELIDCFKKLRQKTCVKLAGKILKSCVRSWSDFYPLSISGWVEGGGGRGTLFVDRKNLSQAPKTFIDLDLMWHLPDEKCKQATIKLLTRWFKNVKELEGKNDDELRAKLDLMKSLLLATVINDPKANNSNDDMTFEIISWLVQTSGDKNLAIDVRIKALEGLLDFSDYRGIFTNRLSEMRHSCRSWMMQLQVYPKQKELPPIFQASRCYVAHRQWMSFRGMFSRGLLDIYPGIIDQMTELALGPFSALRMYHHHHHQLLNDSIDDFFRRAQNILSNIMSRHPVKMVDWINTKLIPKINPESDECTLKGVTFLLRMRTFTRILTSTMKCSERIFQLGLEILSIASTKKIPGLPELVGWLLTDICLYTHPTMNVIAQVDGICDELECKRFDSDNFEDDSGIQPSQLVEKYREKYFRADSSWRMQAVCVLFIGLIADSTMEEKILFEASKFYLESMASEIVQVRSISVNRGISVLYQYLRTRVTSLDSKVDMDKVDRRGDDRWGKDDDRKVLFKLDKVDGEFLTRLKEIATTFVKWVIQESNLNNSEVAMPSFRPDCAEIFQCFTELGGFDYVLVIEEALKTHPNQESLSFQRACAEIYAGLCRGLSLTEGEQSLIMISEGLIRSIFNCAVEAGQFWYEAARFMADTLAPWRMQGLIEKVARSIFFSDSISSSSVTLTVGMYFLTGYLRANPGSLSLVKLIYPPVVKLLKSAYDVVRRSSAYLLVAMFTCDVTLWENFPINEWTGDVSGAKGILVLIEKAGQDPLRTGMWRKMKQILTFLMKVNNSSDVELQKESRRIAKVIAWTSLIPIETVKDFLVEDLLTLVLVDDEGEEKYSINSRKLLLEYGQLFYARNWVGGSTIAVKLIPKLIPLLSDSSGDIRQASADFLTIIFHANSDVSHSYQEYFGEELKRATPKVKETIELPRRHGIVLGAGALILAYPYHIPTWLPRLLTALTPFVNDRHPIHDTTKRLFSEFKRTHGDTWTQEREKFTPDELDTINELLVAPSYYA